VTANSQIKSMMRDEERLQDGMQPLLLCALSYRSFSFLFLFLVEIPFALFRFGLCCVFAFLFKFYF